MEEELLYFFTVEAFYETINDWKVVKLITCRESEAEDAKTRCEGIQKLWITKGWDPKKIRVEESKQTRRTNINP